MLAPAGAPSTPYSTGLMYFNSALAGVWTVTFSTGDNCNTSSGVHATLTDMQVDSIQYTP
jgi:hypothetical protein